MSSVLHPIGPEEPRTYWLRRGVVIGLAVVLLGVVAWTVWPRAGRTAGPAPASTPSMSATPQGSAGTSASPSSPSATEGSSAGASASTTSSTIRKPASPSTSSSATATTTPPVTGCDAEQMRVTLTGDRTVEADHTTTFRLSVINGSPVACTLDLDDSTFELKIYSGSDRIWSTDDCGRWLVAKAKHRLAVEKEYEWATAWTGKRSKSGCRTSGGLKPGTYVATATLKVGGEQSEPVQLVMRLR